MTRKFEKTCPYCRSHIRGKYNFSEHVEKHKRQGDSRDEMLLVRMLRTALSWSSTAFLAIGFLDGDWLVKLINTPTGLQVVTVAIAVLGIVKIGLTMRAPEKLEAYHGGVRRGMDWLFGCVIGGFGRAWLVLYHGLSPFLPNPVVIAVLGTYFLLIVDVVAMRQVFLGRSRWSIGRLVWSS